MHDIKDFNWNKPTNRSLGEYFPADKLDRARYATFLSRLLAQEGFDESKPDDQKKNYVLNLNAEWGAGKTYFLKRWSKELIVNYPVVYIDAWQQDYSDDPFLTVIAGIIKQLQLQAKFNITIPKSAVSMFKAVAPAIAQGLTKKISGIDLDQLHTLLFSDEEIEDDQKQNSNKLTGSDFSPAVKALAQNLIKDHEAKNKSVEVIKSKLADWVSKFEKQEGKSLPIFIFIDELDRCRPSYAVEMLETIKHIFDVKGIVFVVATDTEQLQHTIKSIYGEGFDAKIYLGRFFNSRYSLKRPVLKDFLSVHSDTTKFESAYLKSKNIELLPRTETPETALANISVVLDAFHVSARTAIQITERITAIIANLPSGKKVDVLVLAVLFCIYEKDHPLYEEIINGRFKRTKLNKKSETQNIRLSDYLSEKILPGDLERDVIFFIDSKLYSKEPNCIVNRYKDTENIIKLKQYIESFFCKIFIEEIPLIFSVFGNTDTRKLTELEQAEKELWEGSDSNQYEVTKSLIKYIYVKDAYNQITKEHYRDFIELSSPLDYMGDS